MGLREGAGQPGRRGALECVVAAVAAVVAAVVGRPATPARTEAASTVREGPGSVPRRGIAGDRENIKIRRKAAGEVWTSQHVQIMQGEQLILIETQDRWSRD